VQEVEDLVVGLILDEKIQGALDQVNRRLQLKKRYLTDMYWQTSNSGESEEEIYSAFQQLSSSVNSLYKTCLSKIA
jgi:hypothetical protein